MGLSTYFRAWPVVQECSLGVAGLGFRNSGFWVLGLGSRITPHPLIFASLRDCRRGHMDVWRGGYRGVLDLSFRLSWKPHRFLIKARGLSKALFEGLSFGASRAVDSIM